MADKIFNKRSYTPGSKPTTSNLEASGELAINVNDGKAFLRKSGSGVDTIEEFIITNAINTGSLTLSGSITVTGSIDAYSITSSFSGSLTGSLFGTASWAYDASQSISASSAVSSSYAFSASYAQNASNALTASSADEFIIRTDAFEFTGSINVSGSITLTGSLDAPTITGSLLGTSSWAVSASNAVTAAFATNVPDTASWAISASQALTSSQALTASYALSGLSGTAATASFVTASDVWGPFGSNSILSASYASGSTSASYALFAESASYASGSTSASFALFTISASYASGSTSASYASGSTSASFASFAISASYASGSTSASFASFATSASYASGSTSASYASGSTSASLAATASSADSFLIRNGVTITGSINQTGSFTTTGTLTAQTLIVQTITSSTDFVTGSTRFGSLLTNTHLFTGSVSITGSLNITGSTVASGSFTGSFLGRYSGSFTGSYTGSLTGSLLGTASWATNAITASTADTFVVRNGATISGSVNTTGSMVTIGNRTITGSLLVSGSTSLTGSLGILGAVSASSFTGSHTGSFTGSLIGTASWATNAITASTANTFVVRTGITLTGSLNQSGSTTIIGNQILSGSLRITGSATLTGSLNILGAVSASSFTGSHTGSFTGSLIGTSSWAQSASLIASTGTNAFIQGGNSFGIAAVLGINDNNSLAIETNGLTRLFITGSNVVNTIQYLGATSASNTTSIALPSTLAGGGLIENDLVIVASRHGNVSASHPAGYITGANAFTSSMGYMWAYKFMGSIPDTTVTNITGSTIAFAFRNVNRNIPFNTSGSASGSTGMPDSPAITTTATGSMVVALGFLDRDAGFVVTAPAAYTLIGYTGSTVAANSGSIMGAYFQQTTPGTANPAAFGGTGNDLWVASTLALNPITGSGYVGINNTTPLTTLHIGTPISGDFNLTNQAPVRISLPAFNRSASITEALFIDHAHSDFTSGTAIVIGYKSPTYGGYTSRIINYNSLSTTTGTKLQLQTQTGLSNNTWNTGLLINENNNIGINNITPQYKLDVYQPSGIAASLGGQFSVGSFGGMHFGYLEPTNTLYRKSALVFERTDAYAGQGANAGGKIHFLLNNAGSTSAAALTDSVMTIDSDANGTAGTVRVGIGTRSPTSASLTVNGNIWAISLTGSLLGTASWAQSASNAITAGFASNANLLDGLDSTVFATTGSNTFKANQTISGSLRVTGSATLTGSLNILGAVSASSFTGSHTGSFTGSLIGTASWAQSASNALTSAFAVNAFVQGGNSFAAAAVLGTNNTQNLQFETNNTVRMTITGSNGDVGIGTSTPTSKLTVAGDLFLSGSGNSVYIGNNSDARPRLRLHNNGTDAYIDYSSSLYIRSDTNIITTFLPGGNVGIGTTSPTQLLEVNGNVSASSFINSIASLKYNTVSTYGQWLVSGSKGSYGGIYDQYSGVNGIMYDSAGNGGIFKEGESWYIYYNTTTNCLGVGDSVTNSTYALYVNGKGIYSAGDVVAYSDARKKTDIVTIDNALDKVKNLRGVYYTKIGEEDKGRKTGVIAQEIKEVLPEVVNHNQETDEYGVAYGNIVGVLIEAVKEQQKQIENLQQQINYLTENK
jgi:predicted acyltransferase (DUF342 family)